MKRVTVFHSRKRQEGKVLLVGHSVKDLLDRAGEKLAIPGKKLYNKDGGMIDDVELIRDGDVLVVTGGEGFISVPEVSSVSSTTKPVIERPKPVSKQVKSTVCLSDWITLNVGGRHFTTTRSTLTTKEPDSMLSCMFTKQDSHTWNSMVDETGAYLIDRSAVYFEPILNYLRHGELILDKYINPAGVLEEAKFFGITSMVEILEKRIKDDEPANDSTPIGRREFVFKLISTTCDTELRCQGINLCGTNLSKLDLRHINFKYAILKGANLSGANLCHCNFERADMSSAKLDGANLMDVKMLCINLEGATMLGCNFEDPAGSRANMEGANMKHVNLEGSHMAGVNLRVATLKNANLQNCDLRGAVLAGADLENCDLSGCDLQEANLRGANLKGAAFELMLNPLHMAQAVR